MIITRSTKTSWMRFPMEGGMLPTKELFEVKHHEICEVTD
jgi:hypothetical protein